MTGVDIKAAERGILEFLRAIGHDPAQDPELYQTPARVVEAFTRDLLSGYTVDVANLLASGSALATSAGSSGIVVVRDLAVATVCPHHLMPALGRATVAYLPGQRLLGIGTVAALLDAFARRLTLQEAIAKNVVTALAEHAGTRGAYCDLSLVHSCMSARSTHQAGASVHTVATSGELAGATAAAELTLALRRDESA